MVEESSDAPDAPTSRPLGDGMTADPTSDAEHEEAAGLSADPTSDAEHEEAAGLSADPTSDATPSSDVAPSPALGAHGEHARFRIRRRDVVIGTIVLVLLLGAGVVLSALLADESPEDAADRLVGVEPTDDFDRQSDGRTVGVAANGDSWNAISGVWGIDAAQVFLAEGTAGGARNLLTLDMGSEDGTVAVTFARTRQGAGLVFRYDGPDDFWVLLPARDFGTWVVQHVVDEEVVANDNVGLADSDDGTQVVLEVKRTTITVTIGDNAPVAIQIDPSDATAVGLTALGFGSNEARWDDFYAIPA
jgi:hypothetical protein